MRCALSFLSVLILVIAAGVAAFFIIWYTESADLVCQETHFQCSEDGSCIPNFKRCDGKFDCPNGSDEISLNCSDIDDHAMETIQSLQKCGREGIKNGNRRSENSTEMLEIKIAYPPECTKSEAKNKSLVSIYCNEAKWNRVPWQNLGLEYYDGLQLTLNNVLQIEILTSELVPPSGNSVLRLFIENNAIGVLEKSSICNWTNACRLDMITNSIDVIHKDAFCEMPKLEWLIISEDKFDLKGFEFNGMPLLFMLWLSNNRIEVISEDLFKNLENLSSLKLDSNRIHTVHVNAFANNLKLKEIDLSHNRLKFFPAMGFVRQGMLRRLNFGHNPFEILPDKLFATLKSLQKLNLSGIEITAIDIEALNQLRKLDHMIFKKFSYCRYVPRISRCFPNSDGMSTLVNLMAGISVRVMVWVVAILTLGGNLMVLLSRCFSSSRGRILDVFINNLAVADFFMGIYLLVLAIKDIQYRNSFNLHAYEFSKSMTCSGIGILGMISSEASLLILTIMSVERYLVISGPFAYRKKLSLNFARLTMLIIWLFVSALAVAPAIQWRGKLSFYGSTGLCFPIHLDDPFSIGWQYTAFVFIGLNSTCLIIVAISYSALFCVIQKTRLSTPIVVKDMEMAIRFFLMVFTDCLCWLPIIMLKIYALTGHQIPKELITWVLIFVLPINSTINPYLYTLSMGELRMNLFRRFLPTTTTGNPRRSIINLPLRRHGEESRGNWDTTTNTNTTTGENNKAVVPTRNRASYQESIASSNVSFDPH